MVGAGDKGRVGTDSGLPTDPLAATETGMKNQDRQHMVTLYNTNCTGLAQVQTSTRGLYPLLKAGGGGEWRQQHHSAQAVRAKPHSLKTCRRGWA